MTFLTVKQVAERLQLSPSKVYELLRDKLPRHKIGGAVRIAQDDLDEFLRGCRQSAAAVVPPRRRLRHLSV